MKKVAIVTYLKHVAKYHEEILTGLFGNEIAITTHGFDTEPVREMIDADVVLITLYYIYVEIKKYIRKDASIIIIGTTITEDQYRQILPLPKNTPVMVVNYSPEMAMETQALFRQIGLTQYDFVPYSPDMPRIPAAKIALTPGEPDKVPLGVDTVIDIGNRTLDIETINDLAVKIGRPELLVQEHVVQHLNRLIKVSKKTSVLWDRVNIIESRFFKLLNVIDEGIIATDSLGVVYAINNVASEIFQVTESYGEMKVQDIITNSGVANALNGIFSDEQELISVRGALISLKIVPVQTTGEPSGFLIIANRFEEKEKSQHQLRSKLLGKGHHARYHFSEIIGDSDAINNAREMAKRMAKSETSILITGESGVGKELFAQAIHNASNRSGYQFVAVNCAAIPENLLESELFGYEEGAFTGAKKGGKMGLFELAHKGTLFLDEIGEVPLHLQNRLLRVIQEREIMRVGGENVIHVDVRIITATHRNLRQSLASGTFRVDLYYRLNVLHLEIPPLRNRGKDVFLLMEHFKKGIGAQFVLSDDARAYMSQYIWEGNLRELRNCVEYLSYLDKEMIDADDLRHPLAGDMPLAPLTFQDTPNEKGFVLDCLYQSRLEMKGIGRRRIVDMARKRGVFITENDVRSILSELVREGTVEVHSGRGGTRLTAKGLESLKLQHLLR